MATFKFRIPKSAKEWAIIEKTIKEKNNGKGLSVNGKGFNQFIANEINKKFRKSTACPGNTKVKHVYKTFEITLDDAIAEDIICQANQLGIYPGTLISRVILDPHILNPPPTTSDLPL